MKTPLTLYHLSYCPFCQKVRRAADELGLELGLVDVTEDSTARSVLLQARGWATVPVLRIPEDHGDRFLGESDDIVAFLHSWAESVRKAA